MIEKLDSKMDCVEITVLGKHTECLGFDSAKEIGKKLNELVDAVNAIQKEREAERFEIQEWIGILEAVCKSVNLHEKQIDELQMKLEPEKCETPAENVQQDTETRPENVQDKFAEQKKWIGKLCKFWDIDSGNLYYGPLTKIHETSPYYYECNNKVSYAHCEPVTDDIIYKG